MARGGSWLNPLDSARADAKPRDPAADCRLRPAAHHDVGVIEHDQARRVADRIAPRSSKLSPRRVGSGEAVADRDLARGRLIRLAGMKNGVKTARTAFVQVNAPSVIPGRPPMPERLSHRCARAPLAWRCPAGVFDRLGGCGERKDDETRPSCADP